MVVYCLGNGHRLINDKDKVADDFHRFHIDKDIYPLSGKI